MSYVAIKNCGLKTPEAIAQAALTGASFAGFVHHPGSPRHVGIEEMAQLVAYAKPKLKTVAVLVNPEFDVLYDIAELAVPDYIQLHGVSDPARVVHIRETLGIPVISAIAVETAGDLAHAVALDTVSTHLLFDAKQPGGGQPFDWQLLAHLVFKNPWFLAGGLTAENVAQALAITRAPMVDVSSGIESAPGIKSLEKIAAFNKAVLHRP